jgi:hypothetical protein
MIVGTFAATSLAGGQEQLERMLDLLIDAIQGSKESKESKPGRG